MTAAQTLLRNLQGQEEPEREWSEEELELLKELDELLEEDDVMRYDRESSWDQTDDPFLADLRIGATLCCGQSILEQYFALFPEEDILDESDKLWDACLQCGAEVRLYDGDGAGFCGKDCYEAYRAYPASPEPASATQEAFSEQNFAPFPEEDIPDERDQHWDGCLQCGAEVCLYDGDGAGFCGKDCYQAYRAYPASPESANATQEAFFEQDIVTIGGQFPQAAREIPSGIFFLCKIARQYQFRVTKQQSKWFVSFSTRSMQRTTHFLTSN